MASFLVVFVCCSVYVESAKMNIYDATDMIVDICESVLAGGGCEWKL